MNIYIQERCQSGRNVPVLKTGVAQATEGSNPSLSDVGNSKE